MKIHKILACKPFWWDTETNIIITNSGYTEAIIKQHRDSKVMQCSLLPDTYFAVSDEDGFSNEDEFRLVIENLIVDMMENYAKQNRELQSSIVELIKENKKLESQSKLDEKLIYDADTALKKLLELVFQSRK